MSECKCSSITRLVGDGCAVCNPKQALEYATEQIDTLTRERDEARRQLDAELQGNAALRNQHGARGDETMFAFVERLTRERDGYKSDALRAMEEYGAIRSERDEAVNGRHVAEINTGAALQTAVDIQRERDEALALLREISDDADASVSKDQRRRIDALLARREG